MLGNDIVSLNSIDSPLHQHIDFVRRVCTEREQLLVRASANPRRALAMVWALKEASFKFLAKRDASVRFVPRSFEAQLDCELEAGSPIRASVSRAGTEIEAFIFVRTDWVHAIAAQRKARRTDWIVREISVPRTCASAAKHESAAARDLAEQLMSYIGVAGRLAFANGIPRIRRDDGAFHEVEVGLSHDGPFVAAAISRASDARVAPGFVEHMFPA